MFSQSTVPRADLSSEINLFPISRASSSESASEKSATRMRFAEYSIHYNGGNYSGNP